MHLEISGKFQVGEYVEGSLIRKERAKRKGKQIFYTFLFGENRVGAYAERSLDLKVGEKYLFKVLGLSGGQFRLRLYSFHGSILDALPLLKDFEGDHLLGWILDEYLERNVAMDQDEILDLFFFLKDKKIGQEEKKQWLKKVLSRGSKLRITRRDLEELFERD